MFFEGEEPRSEEIWLRLDRTDPGGPDRSFVPSYHFTIMSPSGEEMGDIRLRIGSDEELYFAGHIGYRVYEPYRGRRYAAKACRLLFPLARKHGMDHLLITCNPDNLASAKTCEAVGGVLMETAELPEDSDMRLRGETHKRIYRVSI